MTPIRSGFHGLGFLFLWSFIGGVSAYDSYLVVQERANIVDLEENPVGRYLLTIADGDVSLLVTCKAAGTVVVLAALLGLYRRFQRISMPVAYAVAAYQFGLLIYMTCATAYATQTVAELTSSMSWTEAQEKLDDVVQDLLHNDHFGPGAQEESNDGSPPSLHGDEIANTPKEAVQPTSKPFTEPAPEIARGIAIPEKKEVDQPSSTQGPLKVNPSQKSLVGNRTQLLNNPRRNKGTCRSKGRC